MDSKNVVENIINVRKSKKISGRKLSLAIGKSEQYMFLIEKGIVELKVSEFIKICKALGVTPNHLISGTKDYSSSAEQLQNLSERDFLLIKHLIALMHTPTEEL